MEPKTAWTVIWLLMAPTFAIAQQSNDHYFQEQQQRQQQAHSAEQARQGYANQQQLSVQEPSGEWKRTWGAIATDNDKGVLGAVVGQSSKGEASNGALADCKAKGGSQCKVDLAYFNQCAAMVMGNNEYRLYGAATVEEAAQRGMKNCSESDTNCRLYYSECTKPAFVRY